MIKKAYQNSKPEKRITLDPKFLLTPPEPTEGLSGNPSIGIGRSFDFTYKSLDSKADECENLPPEVYTERPISNRYKDLLSTILQLADDLDAEGESVLADFSDFLIKKIAQQIQEDPEKLFRNLILKLGNSDILNNNLILIDIVRIYNSSLASNIINNIDEKEAKFMAYQDALEKVKKYVI